LDILFLLLEFTGNDNELNSAEIVRNGSEVGLGDRYLSASEISSTFYGVQQRFCSSYRVNFDVPSQIRFPCEDEVSTIRNSGYNTKLALRSRKLGALVHDSASIESTSQGTSEFFAESQTSSKEVPERFCSSFRKNFDGPSQIRFDCEDNVSEIPNASVNGRRTRWSEFPEIDSDVNFRRRSGE
jgi:hypothetical protein